MNLEEIPAGLRSYVNDYPIHLVHVREFENTNVFKTDLKLVFEFMKCARDRQGMRTLLQRNAEYKTVSRDAYEVMRIHTNLAELDKFIEDNTKEDEEVVDMCQAIREMLEEEREQGIEQGILLHTYRMIERGRMSVTEALEDLKSNQSEHDFIEEMLTAGYKLP